MRSLTRLSFTAGIAAFVFLLLMPPAQAAVIQIYSDRASWESATTGRTDIDFSALGIAPGGWASYSNSAGLTIGGVQFLGYNNPWELVVSNPIPSNTEKYYASGTLLVGPVMSATSYLLATLPEPVTSFGLDVASAVPDARTFMVYLDGLEAGTISANSAPNLAFFGVTSDTPFTQVKISLITGTINTTYGLFDNVSFGQFYVAADPGGGDDPVPSETPEVTTLLYVATGLGLLKISRRRGRELAG